MLSVRGIYENGRVRLLEPVPHKKRHKVIITILEDVKDAEDDAYEIDTHVFDDLVGIIEAREDGSESHDKYILPGKS